MNVEIRTMPAMRLATVRHTGPYNTISEAFATLGKYAGPAGMFTPGCAMVGLYHDNPRVTPEAELRSEAGVSVPETATIPPPLTEAHTPAGRYACAVYVGPYSALGPVWAELMGTWLPHSGETMRDGISFEIYRNTPQDSAPNKLITECYIALV